MILDSKEWKRYKIRNIDRLFALYCSNMKAMHSKRYEFIFKHPYLKEQFSKILKQKFKLDFRISKKASFPNLDFQITTRCTLACEQCCSLMPFFTSKTHNDETFETFKVKLDNLLNNVNYVYRLQLIGGEPLLNKDLPKMVEYASKKRQIKYIVTITNGTMLPSKELLYVYKKYKHKNFIDISDYTSNPDIKNIKPNEVLEQFKKQGIVAYKTDYEWFLRGEIKKENRDINQLKEEFSSCWQQYCPSYCDGELHVCSRSVGIKRNICNELKDCIRITDTEDVANEIIYFFLREYIEACDYCHTRIDIKIPRGVQLERERERERESNRAAAQD